MKMFNSKIVRMLVVGVALTNASQLLAEREGGGRLGASAVEVVFSSPGNGIFSEGKSDLIDLAADKLKSGEVVGIRGQSWGREGEFTLCVQFSDPVKAYQFEQEVKSVIANDPSEITRTSAKRILSCDKNVKPQPHI